MSRTISLTHPHLQVAAYASENHESKPIRVRRGRVQSDGYEHDDRPNLHEHKGPGGAVEVRAQEAEGAHGDEHRDPDDGLAAREDSGLDVAPKFDKELRSVACVCVKKVVGLDIRTL